MADRTNWAHRVLELLGRADIRGYFAPANPTAASADGCSGHDFALVDDRFIADVCVSLFTGSVKQTVFDLYAETDQSEIHRLYRYPATWERSPEPSNRA